MTGTSSAARFARLPLTRTAVAYAECVHGGQHRADGSLFVEHPLEVATLLEGVGVPDHLVAAGALHDVIEKTDVTPGELRARFGGQIAALVLAVSDDQAIAGYAKRKAALRRQVAGAGPEALTLFAADKVSKVGELRREATADRGAGGAPRSKRELRARRLRHYERSLALLEERLPESPLVGRLRTELAALHHERTMLAAPS